MMVSVVMSVYNEEKYIAEAIESILNQTYEDFEFIIINDGSTDNTATIIQSFSDPRIRFINHKENKNQAVRANEGITIAKGKYIARMDGDDIALENRFEYQVGYLDAHPEISIVGSQYDYIDSNGHLSYNTTKKLPCDSVDLKAYALMFCPFIHSSVVFRKSIFEKNQYNPDYFVAQDYDFFTSVLSQYDGYNINEALVVYRLHSNNVHHQKRKTTIQFVQEIIHNYAASNKIELTTNDLEYLLQISESNPITLDKAALLNLDRWMQEFFLKKELNNKFDAASLKLLQQAIWKELFWKIDKAAIPTFNKLLFNHFGIQFFSLGMTMRLLKKYIC